MCLSQRVPCLQGIMSRPGDSTLSPGNGGELGKCAGRGQAGPLTLPQEVPRGRRGGRGPVPGSEPPDHEPGLLLTLRLLYSDPSCSSINACFFLLLSRPLSYYMKSDQGKKVSFVLKFTEIIRNFKMLTHRYIVTQSSPLRYVTSVYLINLHLHI